ncbi:putative disease resistance protein RGA3 [Corylus avellana]|uniref:putative disease resistance protein RGA3 n=1 Tax=Corylus avellana TaxID=13451 RepID=UPI00286BD9F8|nr:putative disease resistance protein RGA3 [Corylus avellana]
MGHRIKAVRARLDEIGNDQIKFGFTERLIVTHEFEHRKREDTHSFVREGQVIGREGEKKVVKELLFDYNVEEIISIIPIVGIGGIGKTTLAQYVFNDDEVKRHFELRLWVCVSDPFDVKTIVAKLIESATKKRPESLEMDLLQSQLRAEIDGKLYLLVLDDVWSENRGTWLKLEILLSGGRKGSKVLITTRSKRVAEITGTMSPYLLGGLSKSNSWNLFKKMAFKDGEEPKNPKLVEIGRVIVQKCAQVPLAIRSIGNYGIEVEVLIHLWAAQGFLHSSYGNRHLEDIGREYFMDLLWRSFFQDVQRDGLGEIIKCKIHDLIHDLAQSVADSLSNIPALLPKANKMRTLLLGIPILPGIDDYINENIAIHESNKPNLQTLRLDFCRGLKELPEDTRNLISLRHLGLNGCNSLTHMPYGLGKLIALQTLALYILGKKKSRLSKPKGELRDLDGLDELRGLLWIKGLEHSRSSPSEAKTANLERKQLRHLMLEWDPKSSEESDKAVANDEQLLQNLQPHLNLK